LAPVKILLDIGDCFSIPLSDGTFAFAQYVSFHSKMGPLIRVFEVRSTTRSVEAIALRNARLLFPPIFVGLNPPVRSGRWKKIGNFAPEDFEFPKFRRSVSSLFSKGTHIDWQIWDGKSYESVGPLSADLIKLEIRGVHAYQDVEERILTGRNWVAELLD
jgi:hypothetical protein